MAKNTKATGKNTKPKQPQTVQEPDTNIPEQEQPVQALNDDATGQTQIEPMPDSDKVPEQPQIEPEPDGDTVSEQPQIEPVPDGDKTPEQKKPAKSAKAASAKSAGKAPAKTILETAAQAVAKQVFKNHPDKQVVYVTADGMPFFVKCDADNYGHTLDDKSVATVTNVNYKA